MNTELNQHARLIFLLFCFFCCLCAFLMCRVRVYVFPAVEWFVDVLCECVRLRIGGACMFEQRVCVSLIIMSQCFWAEFFRGTSPPPLPEAGQPHRSNPMAFFVIQTWNEPLDHQYFEPL